MMISVKAYATLSDRAPHDGALDLTTGSKAADMLGRLGISADEVKLIFINGLPATHDSPLRDGDRVGIFPFVAGN